MNTGRKSSILKSTVKTLGNSVYVAIDGVITLLSQAREYDRK